MPHRRRNCLVPGFSSGRRYQLARTVVSIGAVKTVLFVAPGATTPRDRAGAGPRPTRGWSTSTRKRRALRRPTSEVVDSRASPRSVEVARGDGVAGVLTVSADRAVPSWPASPGSARLASERRRHPCSPTSARCATRWARACSHTAYVASLERGHRPALDPVMFPAVVKPVDSGGQ